ncbi:MAG TPA: hypothetical protein VFZ47_03465 [Chitinophagaceae bacterium]
MSHILKSLLLALAGGVLAILVVYLAEQYQNRKAGKNPLYDAEYVFMFRSDIDSNSRADHRTMEVIHKRLSYAGYVYKLSQEADRRYKLTASDVHDSGTIFKLLTRPGRLIFIETYSPEDLVTPLTNADSLLKAIYRSQLQLPPPPADTVNLPVPDVKYQDPTIYADRPLFALMQFIGGSPDYQGAQIAWVQAKDTQKLSKLLTSDSIRQLFPADLVFVYGRPYDSGTTPMYAIRTAVDGDDALLDESDIANVVITGYWERDPDYSEVAINFNKTGAVQWEELTRKNVGKVIAIVLDNDLLSAPLVNEPITGGTAVLNGPHVSEAKLFEGMMNGGRLYEPPIVISGKITKASSIFRKVRSLNALWLSGLVAFILVFTVHFIFLRPKKNT